MSYNNLKSNINFRKTFRNLKYQLSLIRRYYSLNDNYHVNNGAVFMVDGRFYHGGLADRLKGMISIYAYAKCNNIDYKINHIYPFKLEDFLSPNEYDWRLQQEDISYNIFKANPIVLMAELDGLRLYFLHKNRQHHFYLNFDILPVINELYHKDYTWKNLFHELFVPTQELADILTHHRRKIGEDYIAVVFRFQQLLNDFHEGNFLILPENERIILMENCLQALREIHLNNLNMRILVTSDSQRFLEYIATETYVYEIPGEISHMEFPQGSETKYVHMKAFIDFYMLSRSIKIYSVKSKDMYPTEFPLYASIVGDIPFERVII